MFLNIDNYLKSEVYEQLVQKTIREKGEMIYFKFLTINEGRKVF